MSKYREFSYTAKHGLLLFCRIYGDSSKKTILCLPGLSRNHLDFEDFATRLSGRYQVITPDMRGRGRSQYDPDPTRYHPGTYVADMWRLLAELNVPKALIVGTSLGGLMGMAMAASHPERIPALVLNDIGPELDPLGVARIMSYVGKGGPVATIGEAIANVRRIYEETTPGLDDDFWEKFAHRTYWPRDGQLAPAVDPEIVQNLIDPPWYFRVAKLVRRFGIKRVMGAFIDPWDAFDALTAPTLVLRGENSDILSIDTVKKMHAHHHDLTAVTIPNRGHTPLLDEPEAEAAIELFLEHVGWGGSRR